MFNSLKRVSPRILYCASTASHIRNFHLPYLEYFKEQGWQVDVAVGGGAGPEPMPYADRVIELPLEKSLVAPGNLKALRFVRHLLRENSYALISTHTALAGAVVRLAVKLNGKGSPWPGRGKVVHTSHGYFFNGGGSLAELGYLEAERYLADVTDVLMVMNETDYRLALQYRLGKKVVKIPGMGIDLSRFSPAGPEEKAGLKEKAGYRPEDFLIVYAAEMSKRKNQGEMIRAFALASAREPSMRLILAGDGAWKHEYRKLTGKLGLEDKVNFPGHVQDIAALYKMCDLAAATSKSEGLPFNVMEAMACGLPVVASEVKGHTDLLGEMQCLYGLGQEKLLRDILLRLYRDNVLRKKLGNENSRRIQAYSLGRVRPIVTNDYAALVEE